MQERRHVAGPGSWLIIQLTAAPAPIKSNPKPQTNSWPAIFGRNFLLPFFLIYRIIVLIIYCLTAPTVVSRNFEGFFRGRVGRNRVHARSIQCTAGWRHPIERCIDRIAWLWLKVDSHNYPPDHEGLISIPIPLVGDGKYQPRTWTKSHARTSRTTEIRHASLSCFLTCSTTEFTKGASS